MEEWNIDEAKKDLGDATAIDIMAQSEGGKLIIKQLEEEIVHIIQALSRTREFSHTTYIELSAQLSSKLDMLSKFKRAKSDKEMLTDIVKKASTN